MAKSIVAQSGDVVNYDNIAAIYTDAEQIVNSDDSITTEFSVKADSSNSTYTLGVYESEEKAEEVRNRLVAWLQKEMFAVYDINTLGGD